MIKIKVSGKLLTVVRQEMVRGEEGLFKFILQLVKGLYENREKTVDVSFMMYLSTLEYSSLKVFLLSEELPNIPFSGEIEFSNEYSSFVFNAESLFGPESNSIEYMKFGTGLSKVTR